MFYVFPSKSIGFSIAANRHKSVVVLRLRKPDAAHVFWAVSNKLVGLVYTCMMYVGYIFCFTGPQCHVAVQDNAT